MVCRSLVEKGWSYDVACGRTLCPEWLDCVCVRVFVVDGVGCLERIGYIVRFGCVGGIAFEVCSYGGVCIEIVDFGYVGDGGRNVCDGVCNDLHFVVDVLCC